MILKILRKKTKLIIWLIIVVFCLWGAFSLGVQVQHGGRQSAGKVFGKTVSYQEYDRMYKATRLFSLTGSRVEDPDLLQGQTWHNIILARESRQRRIPVTDEDVRKELTRLLTAQNIPLDAPNVYQNWVRSVSGASPREFEEMIREMLRVQKLIAAVREELSEKPADDQVQSKLRRDNRKFSGDVFKFEKPEGAEAFSKNAGALPAPEPVKLEQAPARVMAADYLLSDEDMQLLESAALNQFLKPMPCRGSSCVFRMTSIEEADPKLLEDSAELTRVKEELIEKILSGKFSSWLQDLLIRAQLKSHLPEPQTR